MTTAHSSIVGGSSAGRLLACPASWSAIQALPKSADPSSEYALEGTAMHEVMAQVFGGYIPERDMARRRAASLLGKTFGDRALTQAHLDDMIYPAIDALDELMRAYGYGFAVDDTEWRVTFPGIPGAFGTVDLMLSNETYVILLDWKFGAGVAIKAVYSDDLGEVLNPQLAFYAAAALNTQRGMFVRRKIVMAIVQPRSPEPLTHTIVSRKELKHFVEDVQQAVVRALQREPHRERGEHCRFAACKVTCPLWTGPLLDLSVLSDKPAPARFVGIEHALGSDYGDYLAKAKALVDLLAQFKGEIDEQLHAFLEDGGVVPGWRLKDKVKQRQWVDANTVEHELRQLGLEAKDIWLTKLQTFAVVDAAAKRLGVKVPDHLRVAPPSTETTVCPEGDPAPPVERKVVMEQFSAALRQLRGPLTGGAS